MEPLAVVKDFDPFKDGGPGFSAGGKLAAMHQFAFEAAPKTFHRRVIIAVAGATHAGNDAGEHQPLPISGIGLLHAAIEVFHDECSDNY